MIRRRERLAPSSALVEVTTPPNWPEMPPWSPPIPTTLDDAIATATDRAEELASGDPRVERRFVGVLYAALLSGAGLTRADVEARLLGRDRLAELHRPAAAPELDPGPAPF